MQPKVTIFEFFFFSGLFFRKNVGMKGNAGVILLGFENTVESILFDLFNLTPTTA